MKRKLLIFTILTAVSISMFGCGKTQNTNVTAETGTSSESVIATDSSVEKSEEEIVGMGNPIEEVTYEKIVEITDCFVTLPEDMESPTYLLINNELGEIRFKMDNGSVEMNFRVQKAEEFTDISGLYYDWKDNTDRDILDYETAKYSYSGDDGNYELILWYNQYQKIMYSLSAKAEDLESFDLYTVAANMAMTDVPLEDYPSNEFEVRVGKTEFDSYDEIIGQLEGSEAYALVNILGHDGEVLLVASGTFDNLDGNMAAIDATPYTVKSSGKVTADSALSSGGTAYPIAIDDNGLIYCGGHREVDAYCYGTNGSDDTAIMMMKYICVTEYDDNGVPVKVSGFHRDINNTSILDNDTIEYAEDDVASLDKAFDELGAANVVNFISVN